MVTDKKIKFVLVSADLGADETLLKGLLSADERNTVTELRKNIIHYNMLIDR